MDNRNSVQVLAITGGKGGVGKTNVAINLSMALSKMQRRVALLDADLGLANIDVLLGLKPKRNLSDVLAGDCQLRDIMLDGPAGIKIIPASSGTQSMVQLNVHQHAALINAFGEIAASIDVLVIDTAAGIADSVVSFVKAAQEVVVVVCDEPSSITDAYALIKLMHQQYGVYRFRMLANMTSSVPEGRLLYQKLLHATDKFLEINLQYAGQIPFDKNLRKAVKLQKPLLDLAPRATSSQAFRALAQKVNVWPLPQTPRGHLEFFIEQLVQAPA